jgi:hypothetical protein
MSLKRLVAAEAKAVWDSLENPTVRKVAEKFAAAGRPVSYRTLARLKQEGWPGWEGENIVKAMAAALEEIDVAAPALTGDVRSTLADIVESTTVGPPDHRSLAEHAEDALREVFDGVAVIWRCIRHVATTQPKKDDATEAYAPLTLLLATPDGIARLAATATDALNKAIEGARQLAVLHAEKAAAVPGAQTVYPPGYGPYAESSHADVSQREGSYPSRAVIEALDQALKDHREGKI